MSIKGRRPRKGSLGTSFIIEKIPGLKRISCSNCINYEKDKSCPVKGVYIVEVGFDFWNQCDKFELSSDYDSEENQQLVSRVRQRIKKQYTLDKEEKNKEHIKSKDLTIEKVKEKTTPKCKKTISKDTVQNMIKQGMSYQKIADEFGVDKDLIIRVDLGVHGSVYKSKKIISRDTVQNMKKQGMSYQKIADKFAVDQDLIRKIDLGFYGKGYIG
ncbi:hypothetical protein TPELB_20090 [Terrisporobacter petrolearius]|uniref:Uncharacterized protein n=1 Tax=Terrisporobacter petrolearius TaxID=1460447 RepID=A0ABZ3FCZ6_9FIRM